MIDEREDAAPEQQWPTPEVGHVDASVPAPLADDAPQHEDDEADAPEPAVLEADEPAVRSDAEAGPASTAWIAWTVAVTLALIAVFSTFQWRAVAGPAADVDAALDAATQYVLALTTWDAAEGLDDTYAELVGRVTDEFRPEIDTEFGPAKRDELVQIDAVSRGEVLQRFSAELLEGDPDSVQVVIVVEQLVLTGPTADPSLRAERVASVRMVRTPDGWLVDDLELLSELELTEEAAG